MKHAERVFIYFIRLPAFNPNVLLHSEQAAQLHCIIRVEAAADKGCGGSDFAIEEQRAGHCIPNSQVDEMINLRMGWK